MASNFFFFLSCFCIEPFGKENRAIVEIGVIDGLIIG
jgi:hypothetical protein